MGRYTLITDQPIVQFYGSFKSQLGLFRFAEFDEAVAHPEPDVRRTVRILAQSFFVKGQSAAKILFVERDARFAQQRRNVFRGLEGKMGRFSR